MCHGFQFLRAGVIAGASIAALCVAGCGPHQEMESARGPSTADAWYRQGDTPLTASNQGRFPAPALTANEVEAPYALTGADRPYGRAWSGNGRVEGINGATYVPPAR